MTSSVYKFCNSLVEEKKSHLLFLILSAPPPPPPPPFLPSFRVKNLLKNEWVSLLTQSKSANEFLFGRTLVFTLLSENIHFDYSKEWLSYIRVTWLSGFLQCCFQVVKLWIVFKIFLPFSPALLDTSFHKGVYTILLKSLKILTNPSE